MAEDDDPDGGILAGQADSEELPPKVTSVSASILSAFFDGLAKAEALADIAEPLRKVVLTDGVFAEPAIKAVLFPSAP